MHRARDVAARCVLVAVVITGWTLVASGCASRLDQLRKDWSTLQARGAPPCGDAADCRALIQRLEQTRRDACGEETTCKATADLEKEIRQAVLAKFQIPCEQGDARACVDAHEFGYDDGLRAACDLGLVDGCVAACADGGRDAEPCEPIARDLEQLMARCQFRRDDRPVACRKLGVLVRKMSASNANRPPRATDDAPGLYATPLLEDRARCRYALDYFSRACHLGDSTSCHALCKHRADEEGEVDLAPCRRVVAKNTAKSLQAACRKRDGQACYDLAILYSRMGFFDRDPAGFFITGPGRVVGLNAMACELGVKEACREGAAW